MKPMLCEKETAENAKLVFNGSEWLCEEKYDGARAYIHNGNIFSRSNRNITKQFPEFDISKFPKADIIDGEIVCNDEFSKTQSRMLTTNSMKIRLMSKHMPATFYAFDYIESGTNQTLLNRKQKLQEAVKGVEWIKLAKQGSFSDMWEYVIENGKEGVIMKLKDSLYEQKRSSSWVKVKAWLETEAVFTKLEHHNKGVRLETPDGKSVNVNGKQAIDVEREFNKKKYVKCEVQYMEIPDSEAWRFPSFRGVVQ